MCAFTQFADEVFDARRAKDIDKAYESIAMKFFVNSVYDKNVISKQKIVSYKKQFPNTYGDEDDISRVKKSMVYISKI
jgi:hypothetical protein